MQGISIRNEQSAGSCGKSNANSLHSWYIISATLSLSTPLFSLFLSLCNRSRYQLLPLPLSLFDLLADLINCHACRRQLATPTENYKFNFAPNIHTHSYSVCVCVCVHANERLNTFAGAAQEAAEAE